MHSFRAVLAWRAPILVDAFRFALAASNTRAAGPKRRGAHNAGRHGEGFQRM